MPVLPADRSMFPYFRTSGDFRGWFDWSEFFGNDNPVELDIGCGRGLFLFNAAHEHPETNWLGMELDFKEARRSARRLEKHDVTNAAVYGGDARVALESLVPAGSVAACHVYFPDPWWKRRHKRRRIVTRPFVDLLIQVTQVGGLLHHWTDVGDYFAITSEIFDSHPRLEVLPRPEEKEPEHDMDYLTSFERKKRKEGETIYRGVWRVLPESNFDR